MIILRKNKFLSVFFIAALSVFIYFVPIFYVLNLAASCITYPFLVFQNNIVVPIKQVFQTNYKLKEKNRILKQERDSLLAKKIKNAALKSYYSEIKEIIEFKDNYNFENTILSQVVMKSFLSSENFFLLNKGSSSGVQKDMVAIYKNNLIGKVVEVYPLYSKLILVTDKSCKVAVRCSKTNTKGIHRGNNLSTESKLMYVSHLDELKEGDTLISSGEGLIFPQGFALGKIKIFLKKDVRYKVKVEPLIELSSVEYCYLVKKT